jgi:hypothetical protein
VAIAAGSNFGLALTSTGTVYAWGDNADGQLGEGSTTQRLTPVEVSDLTGIAHIAAGGKHSLAIGSGGTVSAWGDNSEGQLGIGSSDSGAHSTPAQVSGLANIDQVAAGSDFSLAIRTQTDALYGWGDNAYGQLGDGTYNTPQLTPQPVNLSGAPSAVAGGDRHSLVNEAFASPFVSGSVSPTPSSADWQNQSETVTLTALTVPTDTSSTCASCTIYYQMDPSTPTCGKVALTSTDSTGIDHTGCTQYTQPFGISTEGRHQLYYVGYNTSSGQYGPLQHGTVNIDLTPPNISIDAPAAGGTYALGDAVTVMYSCADPALADGRSGSGVASCEGPVPSGTASGIDTSALGTHTFTVNTSDVAGNSTSKMVTYSIGYGLCLLYDSTKSVQSGATIPIKLYLCDASGKDLSSSSITLHATGVTQVSSSASTVLETSTSANPDSDFRYDSTLGPSGGYIYNLSTKGLGTGTYRLSFTVTGDPSTHTAQFEVK